MSANPEDPSRPTPQPPAEADRSQVARVDPAVSRGRAMRLGLCPRCRVGRIFKGGLAMNPACPSCGLRFEREPGYFTGAMYFSYAFAVPIVAALTLILWLGPMRRWELGWSVFAAGVLFLPLVPAIFRWSRIVWIHMDRYIDPR